MKMLFLFRFPLSLVGRSTNVIPLWVRCSNMRIHHSGCGRSLYHLSAHKEPRKVQQQCGRIVYLLEKACWEVMYL